jgi:predicted transposase YbfD/YdcC
MPVPSFSILRCFSSLKDPRVRGRTDHLLLDIVAIALGAVIAGADNWQQVESFGKKRLQWLRSFLALPNGIPSHDTFERVFQRLDPCAFQRCLLGWLRGLADRLGAKQFAIDGKALRGSGWQEKGLAMLHTVSVWATDVNLTLGQVAVESHSNEIPAIPKLLSLLSLEGALVTIDAMGCQKEIARAVNDAGADYLLVVKGNQERLQEDILESFAQAEAEGYQGVDHDEYETEDDGHGRAEKRSYTVLYDLAKIRDKDEWPGLQVIGLCYSQRTIKGETASEVRLFIGSKKEGAKFYGDGLRNHWGIENNCHWQLDVTFGEDDSRIRQRNVGLNMALLRRVALSLLKQHPGKGSIATKRYEATLDPKMLEEILKG